MSSSSEDEEYRDTSSSSCVLLKLHPHVPSFSKNCCNLVGQESSSLYTSHDDSVWVLLGSMRIIMILVLATVCYSNYSLMYPHAVKNCCILGQQCNSLYCSHDDTLWVLHPRMRLRLILSFSKNCCNLVGQESSSLYTCHDDTVWVLCPNMRMRATLVLATVCYSNYTLMYPHPVRIAAPY